MSHSGVKKTHPKRKGRPRPLPPDVTARNLAIEKKRRGELNEDFLELARLLPSLANTRRLTKVLIVNKSLAHVRQQRDLCIDASRDIQEVLAQNRQLVSEVNALRIQVGGPSMPLAQVKPATQAMAQLAQTKDQVFGTFPAGFGDNWAEEYSQTQKTRSEMHHLPSHAPPVQQNEVNFTPDSMQSSLGNTPVLFPVAANQDLQTNFSTCMNATADTSFSDINRLEAGHSFLDDPMLADVWAQESPPSGLTWIEDLSSGDISSFMQNGTGENEM